MDRRNNPELFALLFDLRRELTGFFLGFETARRAVFSRNWLLLEKFPPSKLGSTRWRGFFFRAIIKFSQTFQGGRYRSD